MKPVVGRNPLPFALLYVVVSIGLEALLIVVGRFRVPDDNAILGPFVLTVPPVLTVAMSGYRTRWRDFVGVSVATSIVTLAITVVVSRLTGVHTGLTEPIVNRIVAGWCVAALVNWIGGCESIPASGTIPNAASPARRGPVESVPDGHGNETG